MWKYENFCLYISIEPTWSKLLYNLVSEEFMFYERGLCYSQLDYFLSKTHFE